MTSEFGKLWLQRAQNEIGIRRAKQEIFRQGRALPCRVTAVSGAIVTVQFEAGTTPWTLPPIIIPKAESPWIRMPTQIGDKGFTVPADAYLGGISGLGSDAATLKKPPNLSSLVFVPVSNAGGPPDDQDAAQLCGPNGAIIRTTQGETSSVVTDKNGTTITFGSTTLTVNAAGIKLVAGGQTFTWAGSGANSTVPITAPDVILPNGRVNGHFHGGVQPGSGNTNAMSN